MSISLYQAGVPTTVKILTNLLGILDKASAYCVAKKIEDSVLLQARLYPDMFPLVRQVQIATDQAKGMAARLTASEVPSFPDTETTIPTLKERIQKTIAFVQSKAASAWEGAEKRDIALRVGGQDLQFVGADYLHHFVLPNFYFHVTTAYAILRHNGVEIGKRDFL